MEQHEPWQCEIHERQAALRLLAAVARADGETLEAELDCLRLFATRLSCELTPEDLSEFDLRILADQVQDTALRRLVLDQGPRLLEVGGGPDGGELFLIDYLAAIWQMEPPSIPGVDWTEVFLPDDVVVQVEARERSKWSPHPERSLRSVVEGFGGWFAFLAWVILVVAIPVNIGLKEAGYPLLAVILAVLSVIPALLTIDWRTPEIARSSGIAEPPSRARRLLGGLRQPQRVHRAGTIKVSIQPAQRCPFCMDDLPGVAAVDLMTCAGCKVVFHRECLDESGSCTTIGCRNNRRTRGGDVRA